MKRGFTLVELLAATLIMAIMMTAGFFAFNQVLHAWQKGERTVTRLQMADYAIAQVVSALRSAYYPTTGSADAKYGFMLLDGNDGDEEDKSDTIQWTKLGSAIVGSDSELSESIHTVRLFVQDETRDSPRGLYFKAGSFDLVDDEEGEERDFDDDDEEDGYPPELIAEGFQGFNCRVLDKTEPFKSDGKWNWQDAWDTSNCIPRAVELTFFLEPATDRDEPIVVKRVVEIPLWDVSQNPISATSDGKDKKEGGRTGGKGGGAPGGGR